MSVKIFPFFLSPDGAEGGTTENCLVITGLNSKWDDNVCANMYQSICECKLSECRYS